MLSILENSSAMGIKVPNILYKSLEKLNKDQDENDIETIKGEESNHKS